MAIRILVVDDATFIRDMIKKQLRDKIPGVEILDAPDGTRALAQLKNQSVDLILSDWEMPNMTGAELLTAVRAMPTMPPAGPERMASFPWNARASVNPPDDCMKNSFTPGISPATCST